MRKTTFAVAMLMLMLSVGLTACGGGGGSEPVTITAISVNPTTVTAGAVIELSASINAPGKNIASLVKNWTVSHGTLTPNQPDFALLLRETAKGTAASSLSTTASRIYWVTPSTAATATITVGVESDSESKTVSIGGSAVTISIGDGQNGAKVVTVSTHGISDLYQAAFRLTHSSAWQSTAADPGNFLGDPTLTGENREVLSLGLIDQNGFVPFSITRLGSVAGVSGSGDLAKITFTPKATSTERELSDTPFEVSYIVLRDSNNMPISPD